MNSPIAWRPLTERDLPAVTEIARQVHPDFPEDDAVFAERLALYPDGTQLLEIDGLASGYLLSHPWRYMQLPALNTLLGSLPADADTYYVHDLALMPKARGTGAAAAIVGAILRHGRAQGLPTTSLVAVNGSVPFWHKHGFRAVKAPELTKKLESYEASARFMVKPA